MAGIKVPQYEIFKIGTDKLKYNNWDITISKKDAFKLNEIIPLFEAQEFRLIAKILNKDISKIDFTKYICSIVIEKQSDFSRATSKKGVRINGNTFRRFVGTTGGLKNNTLLFVNIDIIDELNRRCECGRNPKVELVPAKYEAYKALTCSASQEIISPNRILVVSDCLTKYHDTIISLDNSDESKDSPVLKYEKDVELENNASDGFNLCTHEFMEKISNALGLDYITNGVCLRNAWLKGMLYAFPIIEFFEKYHLNEDGTVNYKINDIWGNEQDIRECDMIVTESSLKLHKAYSNIDEYMKSYKECGYEFSVTKISPHKLDDQRELNYQYLQSYQFDDSDIKEICDPTINWIKDSMCGEYEATKSFIGITGNEKLNTWQKALSINEYMLNDPYIIDSIHRMLKKKINNTKIGKLVVHGNYQIASGDPFALMQHICGLEVTGLLRAGECYSSYWNNEDVKELVVFRSPMTSHNNICKLNNVKNEDVCNWYRYMDNIFILNAWDSTCASLNGCDYDSDILFSTNNDVLLRKHVKLSSIHCAQNNTEKVIITEAAIKKTNKNGMGNQVGTITNRVTAMMEVQSHFDPGTREYEELSYRIACGQLYQQDELDKIKGIIARPMPDYWYAIKACGDDKFLQSVCIDKKPYFMTYVYDDYRQKYKKYIEDCNRKCIREFSISIEELYNIDTTLLTEDQKLFLEWYERKMPFGMGDCAMNKICLYVEKSFEGYKSKLKQTNDFDYNKLKVKRRCTEEHRQGLLELCNEYVEMIASYKLSKFHNNKYTMIVDISPDDKLDGMERREYMQLKFYNAAKEICPNDDERLNIVLDMCYGSDNNKQFCWDVIGDLICKRLEEMKNAEEINN